MKTQDLLMLGGIGLAAYMLMPKAKEAVSGVSPTIISMPAAIPEALDIGGILSGMAGIFGAMPTGIIPEIDIPEFKFPDIEIPEFPDWDKYFPDWEKFIPALPDELKLPDVIPSLIPSIPTIPGNGEGVWQYIKPSFPDIIGDMLGTRWAGIQTELIDMFAFFTGSPRPYEKWLEIGAETEAIFDVAGVSEVTPVTLPIFRRARETITGERAERLPAVGTPEYSVYMGLAPRPIGARKFLKTLPYYSIRGI